MKVVVGNFESNPFDQILPFAMQDLYWEFEKIKNI